MKDGSFPWNPMESEGRRISKKKKFSKGGGYCSHTKRMYWTNRTLSAYSAHTPDDRESNKLIRETRPRGPWGTDNPFQRWKDKEQRCVCLYHNFTKY